MDELVLKNLRIYAYHGCHLEERIIGAWFSVSVRVFSNMQASVSSDNLESAIDYVMLKKLIEEEMAIPSNLIEHVAGRIAKRIKELYHAAIVEVEICKERPPFGGKGASVSIKIKR
ncbi:MAG: 7,8-dihydroneopterin aldolase [Bacteroidia bacterium]|nr:MAG: 7,8-dihydroneopterin aldolase [Bacteroidia bacterium]